MPAPSSWYAAWEELAAVAVMSLAYALAARRSPPTPSRVACFTAGQLLILAAFVTPLGTIALNYLLIAHLLQNVVLAEWAPALIVLGLSPGMAAAIVRHRAIRVLTYPLVSLPLWIATYAIWHIPVLYDAALGNRALLGLEHLCYFASGLILWWPVFREEPRDLPSGAKAAYVFGAFFFASPLGLLFALLPEPIYDFYSDAPRIWGLDALEDQQLAGILMTGSESIVFFGVFAFYFLRFFAEEGG